MLQKYVPNAQNKIANIRKNTYFTTMYVKSLHISVYHEEGAEAHRIKLEKHENMMFHQLFRKQSH